MKIKFFAYLSLIALALIFTGWQTYLSMAQNTPEQPYRTVQKTEELEIRYYPPAVEASVQKSGDYNQMMNGGFRDLAAYIFGGNDRNEKIAMTSPVKAEMEENKEQSAKITFVMPQNFDLANKPAPQSGNIAFSETQSMYAAAIRFGGFANEKKMEQYKELLLQKVQKAGLTPAGQVQFLYYNPPFQLLNRRNEVLVQLSNFKE